MQNKARPLSIFVLTGNEELNIANCLETVVGWSDDIFVVDSDSTDRTVEIAKQYTENVVNHSYEDHASQLSWAFENLPFKNSWVLFLDADNCVTPKLKSLIDSVLANDDGKANGYYCLHEEFFRDKPVLGMKKWWARLVRREYATIDNSELVDYGIKIQGEVKYLYGAIVENNLKEKNIDFWIDKHQRFASRMAAEEILRQYGYLKWSVDAKLFGNSDERRVWLKNAWFRMPLFIRPFIYWIYRYVFTGAFLQGRHGLTFTILQALWFRLVCDLRVQEYRWMIQEGKLTPQMLWDRFGSAAHSKKHL
ncbi:MAG: glycosyltransferase family 2 protein [Pirellulaceae bacterium]|nr:glycosyltransferase family 2 protein [Pirellulaceae bacterium]